MPQAALVQDDRVDSARGELLREQIEELFLGTTGPSLMEWSRGVIINPVVVW